MGGAERGTVGVQGPVGSHLLVYECGVLGVDGSSEGMAGKVVDVQVA